MKFIFLRMICQSIKEKLFFLVSIIFFFSFLSCESSDSINRSENTLQPKSTLHYGDSYLPKSFETDDRISKISSISDSLRHYIDYQSAQRHIPGISFGLIVDDSLVFTHSTGLINREDSLPATSKSVFRIASMSKSFTALAILILRDEGKIDLHIPASEYIPELRNIHYLTHDTKPITVENLLTMTAGFPEDNPWGDRQLNESTEMLMELVNSGISFSNTPSYQYEYSNLGYALLGQIVSNVSQMSFQKYIKEKIWNPLGMKNTYWEYSNIPDDEFAVGYRWENEEWIREPVLGDGSFGSMGGIITTIEDFSKYVSFHLSAWPIRNDEDNKILSRSSIREMHRSKYQRLSPDREDMNGNPCPTMTGYGYGLRITRNCDGLVSVAHGGALPGYGSSYIFYPEYGIGFMAFGNLTYTGPLPTAKIENLLFRDLQLEPRQLPVSEILSEKKAKVERLVQNWDKAKDNTLFAENFFLDFSFEHRKEEISNVLQELGEISEITEITPLNQLRGYFDLKGTHGSARCFFTLTPEADPKVQQLVVFRLRE